MVRVPAAHHPRRIPLNAAEKRLETLLEASRHRPLKATEKRELASLLKREAPTASLTMEARWLNENCVLLKPEPKLWKVRQADRRGALKIETVGGATA